MNVLVAGEFRVEARARFQQGLHLAVYRDRTFTGRDVAGD